ncbi:MAG: class I SAM-dependent methyltransferase [Pirellulaceae bacterium]|nr:class I SAM-dependent methyltransferase [Pirellulaceae bacterium]MDP7018720.1 class I SAM-dependent methyltransferase [Pirellulaceae bacterium]
MSQTRGGECYDAPQYWDLAFCSETPQEADFIEAACAKYAEHPVHTLLEPGCGGGRLVLEMAKRGYDVTGFDLNEPAIAYVKRRLRRRRLDANVYLQDMTDFDLPAPVDAAFNLMNTFRHLLDEQSALKHLAAVARNVKPGGVFLLGFHLLPPDADLEDREGWSERQGATRVRMTLKVLSTDRQTRLERIRFRMHVRTSRTAREYVSEYPLRIYTADQVRALLSAATQWELCDVFDFWYDIDEPLTLSDEMGDTVFVLRRRRN